MKFNFTEKCYWCGRSIFRCKKTVHPTCYFCKILKRQARTRLWRKAKQARG